MWHQTIPTANRSSAYEPSPEHAPPGAPAATTAPAPPNDHSAVEPSIELASAVLDSSMDGIMAFRAIRNDVRKIVDFEWTVVNPAGARILGFDRVALIGHGLLDVMPGNRTAGLFAAYVDVVETARPFVDTFHYPHDGLDRWFSLTAVRLDDGFAVTFRDVTEQRSTHQQLDHALLHDRLTGLANRALLENRIRHALLQLDRRRGALAVIVVAMDRLDTVNDTYGHPTGDQLLVEAGRRLDNAARSADTVARLAGNQFAILCEPLERAVDVHPIAQRLIEVFDEPFTIDGRQITTTSSLGIATTRTSDGNPIALIRDATTALHHAQTTGSAPTNGTNTIEFYDRTLRQEITQRLEAEIELRSAITDHELLVLYQPIIETADQQIVSAEALVRWNHPRRGQLAPAQFIPAAEETGAIIPIGAFVVNSAINQLNTWKYRSPDQRAITVSVNVTAAELSLPDFATGILESLDAAAVPSELLCVEVTETTLIEDPRTALRSLRTLSSGGVLIALDDFGTGYSALDFLRRFPVDIVKIDRTFVTDIDTNHDDRTIVAAILDLARRLGETTIVEGIETVRQHTIVTELGAHRIQGYHYSPPVTAIALSEMLRQQSSPVMRSPTENFPARWV